MNVQALAHPAQAATPFRIRTIALPLTAIVLGTFMAILDNTVVNVALPTLERVFTSDLQAIQWIVTGYLLAQAAVIPLAGWLSDRFGAKQLYLLSLALFALGSLLCALAPSAELLIAFRVLQGLGGGMLMPIGMAFLYRLSPPEQRGLVMGVFGVPILVAPALGPILGGWLVQYADWRYIFLINVPVGLVAVALGLRALPVLTAQRAAGALDMPGMILGPLGFAALSYGISESATAGWGAASTLAGLAVGALTLLAFGARELTTSAPLLELRVVRGMDFSLAIVTQWVGQAAIFGALFLVPLFLQQVRGYGAFATGLYLLPQALGAALFMPVGGRLFDRLGARPTVIAGLVLVTISTWFLAQVTAVTAGADLRWVLGLRGAGMGLMMMPLNTHLLNSAPRALVSRVTALTGALQNVVGSLAIASLATILQSRATTNVAAAKTAITRYQHTVIAHAAARSAHHAGAVPPLEGTGHVAPSHAVIVAVQHYATAAIHTALAAAFDDTFMVATVLAAIGVVLAFTLRRQGVPPTTTAEPAGEQGLAVAA